MKTTYIDLVNRFWAENRRSPFSPCQCALYFFLLNEANALRWEMPFAVPTVVACQLTGMGKSSLVRAREALQQRGLISFSVGTPRRTAPSYVIRDTDVDTKRGTNDGTNDGTKHETNRGTKHETNRGTKHETNRGTIIKDIDKDKDKDLYSYHTAREEMKLEELEKIFSDDTGWQDTIISAIGSESLSTRAQVQERLRMFFAAERAKGIKEREEMDCRSHFFHWVKKSTAKKRNEYANANQRRGTDVTAQSPQDYQGRF